MSSTLPTPEGVFGVSTVAEALERASRTDRGITLVDRALEETRLSYADLAAGAARAAAAMRRAGVEQSDRVCLLAPTSPELLITLFGAWRAGAVPIVLPLPRRITELDAYVEDVTTRVDVSGASLLVVADVFAEQGVSFDGVRATTARPAELMGGDPIREPVPSDGDALALLQFTSGTTARSRAVTLTHRHLLTNMAGAGALAEIDASRDVLVSWLPLFHDMGLIGLLFGSVAYAAPLVLEPTEEFLARPGSWIDAISRYGGTITASPNFGYGLAARDITTKRRRLDLSSLRIAANGAEPVDIDTCATFAQTAGAYGFAAEAMCPMYGLAEATLAVTLSRGDEPVAVEWVDREAFETRAEVVPAPEGDLMAKALVACGHPIPGTRIAIVDDDGRALPDGRVGEVVVQGPGVMAGYWQNPDATAEVIREGWLHTGDIGFLGRHGLVISGRKKDMIILGGRNLYPEDYEFWTERVPGVRRGNVIAFALHEAERMVVVAETTAQADGAGEIAREALRTLRRRLPRSPEEVVLVRAGTLPKTSSGKRQRGECRQQYVSGELVTLAVAR